MAEDTTQSPIAAAEPPKVNPLAKPISSGIKTIKMSPIARPGLKLPPKPTLGTGLKLPPKPNATQSALRPGLKLPTQSALKPGLKLPMQSALKPGLKLPTKPVIRKPGATVTAAPLPKPITPTATSATPDSTTPKTVVATPVAPKPVVSVDVQGVGKLPTVSAPALPHNLPTLKTPETTSPMESLKSVTQKLKGITQPIPQEALLHKTGIVADAAMTEQQKEAVKHKTARISLSEAMGSAPVSNEATPLKTIRIKRPVEIPQSHATTVAPAKPAAPTAPGMTPITEAETKIVEKSAESAPAAAATPATPATTVTQRKTLKIARPSAGIKPTGKFTVKRPGQTTISSRPKVGATATAGATKADAAKPAGEAPVGEIADIPDIPNTGAPIPPMPAAKPTDTTPPWVLTLSLIVQAAACVAIGTLAWFLYQNTQTQYF